MIAAGHLPRHHPLVPGLDFSFLFNSSPRHAEIKTIAALYGSTYTLTGTTRGDGRVEAEGSSNGGPWQQLTSSIATAGHYTIRFPISDRGTLKVRVKYPGGEADGSVLVR